jgi:hypothetical protein
MRTLLGLLIALLLGLLPADRLSAQENGSPESPQDAIGPTPPRLSFVDGPVSFLRPGDQDWTQAQVNMALSPGDQLYTGSPGNLEIQIGARAFVRGWANTRIGLENLEPDYLQIEVTAGQAVFDLRSLEPGRTVEVDTPNAAFTIDRAGYYRVNVTDERTAFIARRGGRAVVIPADGTSLGISPSEEVVIEGAERPTVSSYSAPPLDAWDNWNYARTDRLLEAESERYVPPGVYGTRDLDHYGRWRVVPDYGPVWVPTGMPAGWAPYSTGSWVLDPYYGWTWVDTAPWGWAPYHYGRWVYVGRYWCWAPGPMVARPVYSPALVAFFGGPHGQVAFGTTGPVVGWVALGWGEPCVPWWGRPGFIHHPWWGGWGGPRIVNNVVVHRTTVVNVEEIHDYRNTHVHNAVVAAPEDRFHRGGFTKERFSRMDTKDLRPMHTAPRVRETPASFVPKPKHILRPPEKDLRRPVVATRPPHASTEPAEREERKPYAAGPSNQGSHIVQRPQLHENSAELPRPPFGPSTIERHPETGRAQQPAPPKNDEMRSPDRHPASRPPVFQRQQLQTQSPQRPENSERAQRPGRPEQALSRTPASSAPAATRIESSRAATRQLPGEPASRIAPNRLDGGAAQRVEPGVRTPQRVDQRGPAADVKRPTPSPDNPRQVQRPGERPPVFPRFPGGA